MRPAIDSDKQVNLELALEMDSSVEPAYPPIRSGLSRRPSANIPRLDSSASIALTSRQPTLYDPAASKDLLLPVKPDPSVSHQRPIASLERDVHHSDQNPIRAVSSMSYPEATVTTGEERRSSETPAALEGGTPTLAARHHLEGRGWAFKALFILTTCSAQLIAQGQFGMVLIPLYEIGAWLGTQEQGQLGWMAASYG